MNAVPPAAPEGLITAETMPGSDAILERDLAFHLGDREAYEFCAIAAVCASRPAPDASFVCLQPDQSEFIAGDFFKSNCSFANGVIALNARQVSNKQRRTIETINRDLVIMDHSIPYCFDFRDGRQHDYSVIFGTRRAIPVFQYHRRRGLVAIIHPLRRYHEYPSLMLPEICDTKGFHEKRAKMFWRGSLNGRVMTPRGPKGAAGVAASEISDSEKVSLLRSSLRFSLCYDNPDSDILDAGLVIRWGSRALASSRAALEALCRPRASTDEHLEYRYLLALDGYDGPSSLYWMLGTHSLVLRQESPWEMFGDSYFAPWVHFVPFAADGSDLVEKFHWCERNSLTCARIVENANRAWSILFDVKYQEHRRHAVMNRYRDWVRSSV